ncbi:hypothetical protein NQZ68_034384 [Dissostichus eleginoides]|nr:hypothetical protein NQZ68_034384 [Dissostichus eleginoides]
MPDLHPVCTSVLSSASLRTLRELQRNRQAQTLCLPPFKCLQMMMMAHPLIRIFNNIAWE